MCVCVGVGVGVGVGVCVCVCMCGCGVCGGVVCVGVGVLMCFQVLCGCLAQYSLGPHSYEFLQPLLHTVLHRSSAGASCS